ncbi:MAG: hypothetical protein IT435_18785 [Phycisphaerales bacterium]|nr:hypothetical protein [Phycisphaerales bacterium]
MLRTIYRVCCALILCAAPTATAQAPATLHWDRAFSRDHGLYMNGIPGNRVRSIVNDFAEFDPDGNGSTYPVCLVAGGLFVKANWNGSTGTDVAGLVFLHGDVWHNLAGGVWNDVEGNDNDTPGYVYSLEVFTDENGKKHLLVAGDFDKVGGPEGSGVAARNFAALTQGMFGMEWLAFHAGLPTDRGPMTTVRLWPQNVDPDDDMAVVVVDYVENEEARASAFTRAPEDNVWTELASLITPFSEYQLIKVPDAAASTLHLGSWLTVKQVLPVLPTICTSTCVQGGGQLIDGSPPVWGNYGTNSSLWSCSGDPPSHDYQFGPYRGTADIEKFGDYLYFGGHLIVNNEFRDVCAALPLQRLPEPLPGSPPAFENIPGDHVASEAWIWNVTSLHVWQDEDEEEVLYVGGTLAPLGRFEGIEPPMCSCECLLPGMATLFRVRHDEFQAPSWETVLDGTLLSEVPNGGDVVAMHIFEGKLYVGGFFSFITQGCADGTNGEYCTDEGTELLTTPTYNIARLHMTCIADADGSGFVDTDDFDYFIEMYELGDCSADADKSGFVDTDDYDHFVFWYEEGC